MTTDLYLVLNVTRGATPDQIRSAYRRRALELHPDRSGGASEPFLELQRAYSVLSDPAQRSSYDDRRCGPVSVRRRRARGTPDRPAEPLRDVRATNMFPPISLTRSFDTFGPSLEELFGRLWSNFDGLERPKAEHLESLTVDVPLSVEDAWAGGSVTLLVPARMRCQTCHGRGGFAGYECWRCSGHGVLTTEFPVEIPYPRGMSQDHVVRVPLDDLGIRNFYLTVRFRLTDQD